MPYDASKDQIRDLPSTISLGTEARTGADAVASDTVDLSPYGKSIVLLSSGTLKLLPVENDDTKPIAFTEALPVGWVSPWRVRRVFSTGTSATFATIDG